MAYNLPLRKEIWVDWCHCLKKGRENKVFTGIFDVGGRESINKHSIVFSSWLLIFAWNTMTSFHFSHAPYYFHVLEGLDNLILSLISLSWLFTELYYILGLLFPCSWQVTAVTLKFSYFCELVQHEMISFSN